jgi:hypothetical protein
MDALSRVLDGRTPPVTAFDIDFKYMGLCSDWFADVFAELCGSGGLLEFSLVNAKLRECYHLPAPIYRCTTLTSLDLYNWRLQVPGRITGLHALRLFRPSRLSPAKTTTCQSVSYSRLMSAERACRRPSSIPPQFQREIFLTLLFFLFILCLPMEADLYLDLHFCSKA